MPPFQAILFDLDGVIIDSEPLHEESKRIVFQRYGLDVPEHVYSDFKGKTDRDVIEFVVQDYGNGALDVEQLIEAKQRTYQDLIDHLQLVPEADAFIRSAAERYRLALTTSAVPRNQEVAFEKFGLHRYFEVVVTARDITRAKPDPEPYLTTANRMGVPAGTCLVVEDSLNGVLSGVAAGCTVAALTTSFDAVSLERVGAHLVVPDFRTLAERLDIPL